MDTTTIREAAASDAGKILPLIEAYWRHDAIEGFESSRLHRQLDAFLSTPAYGRAWLAMRADVAVGYLLCTLVYSFEHGGQMAEVDELFVGAEYRQRGTGRALLARARSDLTAHGCVCLQMQVADGNAQAQRFYSRQGFKQKSDYRLWVAPLQPQGSDGVR